jgi:hypothetical protein
LNTDGVQMRAVRLRTKKLALAKSVEVRLSTLAEWGTERPLMKLRENVSTLHMCFVNHEANYRSRRPSESVQCGEHSRMLLRAHGVGLCEHSEHAQWDFKKTSKRRQDMHQDIRWS